MLTGAVGLAVVATKPLVEARVDWRTFYYLGGGEGKSRKGDC
jgi:hypothetical protein